MLMPKMSRPNQRLQAHPQARQPGRHGASAATAEGPEKKTTDEVGGQANPKGVPAAPAVAGAADDETTENVVESARAKTPQISQAPAASGAGQAAAPVATVAAPADDQPDGRRKAMFGTWARTHEALPSSGSLEC